MPAKMPPHDWPMDETREALHVARKNAVANLRAFARAVDAMPPERLFSIMNGVEYAIATSGFVLGLDPWAPAPLPPGQSKDEAQRTTKRWSDHKREHAAKRKAARAGK